MAADPLPSARRGGAGAGAGLRFSRVLASCVGSLGLPARKGRTPRVCDSRDRPAAAPLHRAEQGPGRRRGPLPLARTRFRGGVASPGTEAGTGRGSSQAVSRTRPGVSVSCCRESVPGARCQGAALCWHPERPPVTPASASASPAPHGSRFPKAQSQLLSHSPPAEAETAASGYT